MNSLKPDDWAIIYAIGFAFIIGILEGLYGFACSGALLFFAAAGCTSLNPEKGLLIWLITGSSIPLTVLLAGWLDLQIIAQTSWMLTWLAPFGIAFVGMFLGSLYGAMYRITRDY